MFKQLIKLASVAAISAWVTKQTKGSNPPDASCCNWRCSCSKEDSVGGDTERLVTFQSPFSEIDKGRAPGMKYRLLSDQGGVKSYVLIFAKGDEVLSGINDFAQKEHITAAHFSAIGALSSAKTAWFDLEKKEYRVSSFNEQLELVSMNGDIGVHDGTPTLHTHYAVADLNGKTHAGHLIEAVTMPTVELFMTTYPVALQKNLDEQTDLKLFHPEIL